MKLLHPGRSFLSRIDLPISTTSHELATPSSSGPVHRSGGRYHGRRVVFVVNTDQFFVSHRLSLGSALVEEGARVSVLTQPTGSESMIRRAGIEFVPIDMNRAVGKWTEEMATVFSIWDAYRTRLPDIVHHVSLKSVVLGSLAARAAGVPCVVNAVTGLGYSFARSNRITGAKSLIRTALPAACSAANSRLIVQNSDDQATFLENGWARPEKMALIRGAGVDCQRFAFSREIGTPPIRVVLGARMIWDKGIRDFVDVARLIVNSNPDVKFLLAGPLDPGRPGAIDPDQLAAWVAEGIVEWLGYRPDMDDLLRRSHIAVLPSHGGEGLPKFLLEAAASGRPAIASDVPGCREIVRDGVNGILVPPGDVAELARAVSRLVCDSTARARMGLAGSRLTKAEFGIDKVIGDTFRVYDDLLSALPVESGATDSDDI